MTDLRFVQPLGTIDPLHVELRLGVQTPATTVQIQLQVPAPVLVLARVRHQAEVAMALQVAAPVLRLSGQYDSQVSRPLAHQVQQAWQQGQQARQQCRGQIGQANVRKSALVQQHQQGSPVNPASTLSLQQAVPCARHLSTRHQPGQPLAELRSALWQQLRPQGRDLMHQHQQARPLGAGVALAWRQLLPRPREAVQVWQQAGALHEIVHEAWQQALVRGRAMDEAWQQGRQPPPGRTADVVVVPPRPYTGHADLRFRDEWRGYPATAVPLRFGTTNQRTIFIVNEIHFTRLQDGRALQLLSCNVGIDLDSWCWSFTGSIPFDQVDLLDPALVGNAEVELLINGLRWRFMIEGFSKSETFGQTTANLRGRSLTARLDDPYAPLRTHTEAASKTAVQLAQQELDRAGTGYALDWGLVDALGWTVPGGAWSYQGLSPAQAIKRLATDAGGVVQSHPWEKRLIVRPEYSLPPWQWTTADLTIDPNLIRQRGTEWQEKPAYNGVLVSGTRFGVSALVKVTGTDGAFQPQAVVASVLTEGAANRQRGLTELSRYGPQRRRSLEMPLHPDLGLVMPGLLVGVGGSIGMVRSVGISAQGGGRVSQTMEVEEHVG